MSAPFDELSILEYSGQLQPEVSAVVRNFGEKWGISLFDSILETHVLSEVQLRDALARALQLATVDEISLPSGWEPAYKLIDYKTARSNGWLVGAMEGSKDTLEAYIANPITTIQLKQLLSGNRQLSGILVAERSEVVRAVDLYYPLSSQIESFV
jgi:hypothetical protein